MTNAATFAGLKRFLSICAFVLISTPICAQYCIDSISFSNDRRTKYSVLLRELNVQKGDCIPQDSLAAYLKTARDRLMNTQLFNEVHIDTERLTNDGLLIFDLKYRFPLFPEPNVEFADRNFNVWWNEQNRRLDRINLGLTLWHQNVRGRRERLGVGAQFGYTKKFMLSYEKPFIDKDHKHGTGASFAYLQNNEIAYKTVENKLLFHRFEEGTALKSWEAALWYTYRPAFATKHTLKLALQQQQVHDSIAQWLNPDFLGGGKNKATLLDFSYRFDFNGVDNWNYPLIGRRFIGIAALRLLLGGAVQPEVHVQADVYKNPLPKWYVSGIFRARKAFGNSSAYILQRNLGYDLDFVRGYEYFVMDGDFFALGRLNVKRSLVNTQIRLPINYFQVIPLRIYPKIYADVGYGHSRWPAHNSLSNKMLLGYGIGVDVVTLYDIKIRLEYTFNKEGLHDLYIHKSGE